MIYIVITLAAAYLSSFISFWDELSYVDKISFLSILQNITMALLFLFGGYAAIDEICDRQEMINTYNEVPPHIKRIFNFEIKNQNRGIIGTPLMFIVWLVITLKSGIIFLNSLIDIHKIFESMIELSLYT